MGKITVTCECESDQLGEARRYCDPIWTKMWNISRGEMKQIEISHTDSEERKLKYVINGSIDDCGMIKDLIPENSPFDIKLKWRSK